MIPKRIAGATHNLAAPTGWNPSTQGPCGNLWVRYAENGGLGVCESAWEPTPAELALLIAGGSVVLRVVGGQPPVALYVEPMACQGTDERAG